ncbi:hypothetical protein [Streptomyces sp. NPDC059862]|uniref:hypothetical protein n=1 Tax=unclassified Streptomyces TaxID=2593676 RepID=UPI0036434C42
MTQRIKHPAFARFYAKPAGLSGEVIEVGAGNGLNFPHYPPEVKGSSPSNRNPVCALWPNNRPHRPRPGGDTRRPSRATALL